MMVHNVEVANVSEDGLSREVWSFSAVYPRLYLRSYSTQTRESSRHKFKVDYARSWSSDNPRAYRLASTDVPLPDDLAERAKAAMIQAVKDAVTVDFRNVRPEPQVKNAQKPSSKMSL